MIRILTTGGTIDKIYFDSLSEYEVGNPVVDGILREGGVTVPYIIESVLKKDSLEITDEDRAMILEKVNECIEERILITHGTDTLALTGQFLQGKTRKTVVLTGSLQPANFRFTDAVFNVAFAMGALQSVSQGVYLAMNGQVFHPDRVRKNREKNRFEPTS
ncbi:MAG: asparaginase [Armatimonadetes bacterium Cent15-Ar3]|nr:MAG: asparaginase [Armatimonadetes bacterium Cent15-Ar3]